jgi:two-component SAPR family response regulator
MTFSTGSSSTPDLEQAVQRVKDLSEKAIETSKQNGRQWLDSYEKIVESFLKAQQQAAQGSQVEWVTTLANTNADFVREVSQAYLSTVRETLK